MSTLSPRGRALVRAGRRAFQPSEADRVRLTNELRSQLGGAALPTDIGTVASAAAAAGKTIWPLVSVVVVSVGVLGGALFVARQRLAEHDKLRATTAVATVAATQTINPIAPPIDEQPTSLVKAPSAGGASAPARRPQDRLAAEVALLSRATRDLHAGRPADAIKTLDEYRHKFPKGLLGEEQGAARAQALCALGRFDEANAKLAGLAPQSPLAVRAKQYCEQCLTAR